MKETECNEIKKVECNEDSEIESHKDAATFLRMIITDNLAGISSESLKISAAVEFGIRDR